MRLARELLYFSPPALTVSDQSTWTPTVLELVKRGDVTIKPYDLVLDYETWSVSRCYKHTACRAPLTEQRKSYKAFSQKNYMTKFRRLSIRRAILVSKNQDSGIATTKQRAAHLNLREQYHPYKQIIGEVILASIPTIRTVINKTETLGSENEFRVLGHELLAGENTLETEAREGGSIFRFDYSKVFWNSKLGHEHERLVGIFQPGEAVCDVMAGVGPFAIPAGRNGVFVWANDLNPDCYTCLVDAIDINKVREHHSPLDCCPGLSDYNRCRSLFVRTMLMGIVSSGNRQPNYCLIHMWPRYP